MRGGPREPRRRRGAVPDTDVPGSISVAMKGDGTATIVHRLDGRSRALDPGELTATMRRLADLVDVSAVDYVVGFPEGGSVPAFAFAQVVRRPLVLSTRLDFALPGADSIVFGVAHSPIGRRHHIHGLRAGDRVVIIEDEVTSGGTILNAARALRAAGVTVSGAGALMAVDDPRLWRALEEERVLLHVLWRLPAGFRARPGAPPAGPADGG